MIRSFVKISFVLVFVFFSFAACLSSDALAAKNREVYDIIYIISTDLEKVLDYKDDLESVFDAKVLRRLKVVGNGTDYGLIYDCNLSARAVARTLVEHAELLNAAGFDEPFAIKEKRYTPLFNVSYGIGPNVDPLKKKYQILYNILGEEVQRELFIEQTDFGNYVLVYHLRGDEATTNRVAKQHSALLRSKKIKASLVRENNNTIVYGESSLIDDGSGDEPVVARQADSPAATEAIPKIEAEAGKKAVEPVEPVKLVAMPKIEKSVLGPSNSNFEKSIASYISELRSKGVIDGEESIGWVVYDLEHDQNLVSINANTGFQAASMIKPFVALAYFHMVNDQKLTYGSQARRKMESMIQRSSNSSTNWVMKQVGGPALCNAILKKNYGHILRNTEVKEYIPADGRTYLNSAPPADYVRFLRALWNQELPYSKEIRRLMALPGRDRLYYGTPIPRGTLVYNKTGSTAKLCGDMGILVPKTRNGNRYPYVVVGIIERKSRAGNYGQWMNSRGRVIRQLSTLVYEEMKKEHHLM